MRKQNNSIELESVDLTVNNKLLMPIQKNETIKIKKRKPKKEVDEDAIFDFEQMTKLENEKRD